MLFRSTVKRGETQLRAVVSGNISSSGVTFLLQSGSGQKSVAGTKEGANTWVATIPADAVLGSTKISAKAISSNGDEILSGIILVKVI